MSNFLPPPHCLKCPHALTKNVCTHTGRFLARDSLPSEWLLTLHESSLLAPHLAWILSPCLASQVIVPHSITTPPLVTPPHTHAPTRKSDLLSTITIMLSFLYMDIHKPFPGFNQYVIAQSPVICCGRTINPEKILLMPMKVLERISAIPGLL